MAMKRSSGVLEGKVAIVTGASRGIGAAAARAFADAGAGVVLAARTAQAIADLAAEINAAGGRALAIPTDVIDPESVEGLVEHTVASFGRLDVAFNNAGAGQMPKPLADISLEDFEMGLRANLYGAFVGMKYEIPAMLAAGGGAIVNMSSTAGLQGARGMGPYAAAKTWSRGSDQGGGPRLRQEQHPRQRPGAGADSQRADGPLARGSAAADRAIHPVGPAGANGGGGACSGLAVFGRHIIHHWHGPVYRWRSPRRRSGSLTTK